MPTRDTTPRYQHLRERELNERVLSSYLAPATPTADLPEERSSPPLRCSEKGKSYPRSRSQVWVKADPGSLLRLHGDARVLVFLLREGVPGPREGGLQPAPPSPNTARRGLGDLGTLYGTGRPPGSKKSGWREKPQTRSEQRVSMTPSCLPFSLAPFLRVLSWCLRLIH